MAALADEELPRPKPQAPNLERMGIDELKEYIAQLQAEIARAQAMIDSKQNVRSGANALFKT